VLTAAAAACLAWTGARAGFSDGLLAATLVAGGAGVAAQMACWCRRRRQPARRLHAAPDGTLWLQTAGQPDRRVTLGRATRLLGPSVYLDLHAVSPEPAWRSRRWISPFDAPEYVLRQWSVVLPRSGRVACT
jgi:hypothetical protein